MNDNNHQELTQSDLRWIVGVSVGVILFWVGFFWLVFG